MSVVHEKDASKGSIEDALRLIEEALNEVEEEIPTADRLKLVAMFYGGHRTAHFLFSFPGCFLVERGGIPVASRFSKEEWRFFVESQIRFIRQLLNSNLPVCQKILKVLGERPEEEKMLPGVPPYE